MGSPHRHCTCTSSTVYSGWESSTRATGGIGLRLLPFSEGVFQSSLTFWKRVSRGSAIGGLAGNCAAAGSRKHVSTIASENGLMDLFRGGRHRRNISFPKIGNLFGKFHGKWRADIGPPFGSHAVESVRLLDYRPRPNNRAQASIRQAALNHRAAFFGGDADRGRDDHSAHIAAFFWHVAGICNSSESSELNVGAVILLIVRANQFEAQIRHGFAEASNRTYCFEGYVVRGIDDDIFLRGIDERDCVRIGDAGGHESQQRP